MPTRGLNSISRRWLNLQEVYEVTGFGRQTIRARIERGDLAARQDDRGHWQISRHELLKLCDRLIEPMYSLANAAAVLGFDTKTMEAKLREGVDFPGAAKLWSEWRVPESDLADFIARGVEQAKAEREARAESRDIPELAVA